MCATIHSKALSNGFMCAIIRSRLFILSIHMCHHPQSNMCSAMPHAKRKVPRLPGPCMANHMSPIVGHNNGARGPPPPGLSPIDIHVCDHPQSLVIMSLHDPRGQSHALSAVPLPRIPPGTTSFHVWHHPQ